MKTIQVIANPYSAIDADGVPQGVVGLPGARLAWVGATLDPVATKTSGKTRFYFPGATKNPKRAHEEKEISGLRVVTLDVENTTVRAAVANAVLEGSLIAVDKAEAAQLGIVKEFLDAAKALDAEKEKALDAFRALRGKDAELEPIPHEATKAEEPEEDAKASPAPQVGERVGRNLTLQPSTEA